MTWLRCGVLIALLAASSCGGGNASPTTTAARQRPTPSPTLDKLAVPSALVGTWRTQLAPGDVAQLSLSGRAYTINRSFEGPVHGKVAVEGERITFSASDFCPNGKGVYQWAIEGDKLTLNSIQPDECPGRATAIDGQTFTRRA